MEQRRGSNPFLQLPLARETRLPNRNGTPTAHICSWLVAKRATASMAFLTLTPHLSEEGRSCRITETILIVIARAGSAKDPKTRCGHDVTLECSLLGPRETQHADQANAFIGSDRMVALLPRYLPSLMKGRS